MMFIDRAITPALRRAVRTFAAVLLTGPRQVGKSTLLRHEAADLPYVSFDDPTVLQSARTEPGLFFRLHRAPLILDEIQYCPGLFPYIKMECDKAGQAGMFWLTGSQQYHLMHNVSESLAGRVAILNLPGLSLREISRTPFDAPFIPTAEYVLQRSTCMRPEEDIWARIWRGGFPAMQDPAMDWQMFYGAYLQTYIERDVRQLVNVKDTLAFTRFMTVLAAHTGGMLNYAAIADKSEVSAVTVKSWMSVLEASGLVCLLEPYSNSALTRATRTPKLYFLDTGLACFLTRYQSPATAASGALAGQLFETFVVSEIIKSFANAGMEYRFYLRYYRGKDKQRGKKANGRESEIDLIIDADGVVYPVEIKMTANPNLHATNAFDVLNKVDDKKRGPGTVVCLVPQPVTLHPNVTALPVECI